MLFFPCLIPATSWALSGCIEPPDQNVTQVYFANGMLTDSSSADITVRELRNAYKAPLEAMAANTAYVFLKAYNASQGGLTDVLQVLEQKMVEAGIADSGLSAYQLLQLLSFFANDEIRNYLVDLPFVLDPTGLAQALSDSLLEELGDTVSMAMAAAIEDRRNVNVNHVSFYESDLSAGKRVLIVAHSQGNLFSNEALLDVIARQPAKAGSIAVIGIASPAAGNVAGNLHYTANDDRVIDLLRAFGTVLPANVDNDPGVLNDFRSLSNHYFERDYFDSRLASRALIDAQMTQLATTLPYPTVEAGEGAIRATLTWGAEPDLDLHVFEPDGTHVYYLNRVGPSGFLDVDDQTSFGPENYFVECDAVTVGRYQIAVNYFEGVAPETATVTLFLGSGQTVSARSVELATPLGVSGNANPTVLFVIDVTANQDDTAIYNVLP